MNHSLSEKVVILHDQIPPNPKEDELDVLVQAEMVSTVLEKWGFTTVKLPFSLAEIPVVIEKLQALKPKFVFNLVETVAGTSSLCFIAGTILEHLKLKYTGNDSQALLITTNKIFTKKLLQTFDINTPEWITPTQGTDFIPGECYIIKPVSEEGSVGIDNYSLIRPGTRDELLTKIQQTITVINRDCFAEKYIDGREFNIAILGKSLLPEVLPLAEMLFQGYMERNLPRIVNYNSKWKTDSDEYMNTVRSFQFNEIDQDLTEELMRLTKLCWHKFQLRGYARIDFRVDRAGKPWVIDINANPCLSPESGFVAAAKQADIGLDEMVKRIVTSNIDL